jgi:hypothetical protein
MCNHRSDSRLGVILKQFYDAFLYYFNVKKNFQRADWGIHKRACATFEGLPDKLPALPGLGCSSDRFHMLRKFLLLFLKKKNKFLVPFSIISALT